MPWHAYYRGEWYTLVTLAVFTVGGLRMLWSSVTPLDEYTRRLRGDQSLWGRLLGILMGLLFLAVGTVGLGIILLGASYRPHWFH